MTTTNNFVHDNLIIINNAMSDCLIFYTKKFPEEREELRRVFSVLHPIVLHGGYWDIPEYDKSLMIKALRIIIPMINEKKQKQYYYEIIERFV